MHISCFIQDDEQPQLDLIVDILQKSDVDFNFVDHTKPSSNWEKGRIGLWVATKPAPLSGFLVAELSLTNATFTMYNSQGMGDPDSYVAEYMLANPNFSENVLQELNRLARYGIGSDFSFDQ